MKKYICILLLSLIGFIVVGCSDSGDQETQEKQETEQKNMEGTDNEVEGKEGEQENTELDPDDSTVQQDQEETQSTTNPEEVIPQYELDKNSNIVPITEEANEKVVLLTIDDAPDKQALQMAQTLKELDAPAIFFVNGHFLDTDEEKKILQQIHDMGFAIGNHTYNHQRLSQVSEEKQKEEIVSLSNLAEEIIGERPKFFRAPNGDNTEFSEQFVKEQGMLQMNWTYGYDYFEPYMDADKLAEAMITGEGPEVDVPYSLLKPGANLLMHDRPWTAEALDDIVKGLREKGYEMVDPALIKLPE
ncbi:polysaccharide deacetylase family protein [Aquibacillus kalidii]|uniref:polysaccharide deacetylase family protein n=1 Tax=Aquibacillus kalidii TaxID=2762597 RepID=UPI0016489AE5|nr:polysaccharide deacetylase family protein [Aquibacillus kalidii]